MNERVVKIMGYDFIGPYPLNKPFKKVAGIYLITKNGGAIVDVGETENLSERIPNHDRVLCWRRNNGINLWFHFENNKNQRVLKEKALRNSINPVCGIK